MTPHYQWPRSADVIAARAFLRLAARIVPGMHREQVVEEWEAELWMLVASDQQPGRLSTMRRSLVFCAGIVPYALWSSRGRSHQPQPRQRDHRMNTFLQDISYAVRTFTRNPTFAAAVILTLALGIGASTTVFSVVNGVVLRPLPYDNPDRLVMVGAKFERFDTGMDFSPVPPRIFQEWKDNTTVLDPMVAVNWWSLDLDSEGTPQRLSAAGVSAEFFSLLGVTPVLGRGFLPEEDQPNTPRVAVLSHRIWQSRWGGSTDILGKTLSLSADPVKGVGD